jgi:hypothetical protein
MAGIPVIGRQRLADIRGRGVYAGYPNRHRCIFIHIPKTAGSSVVRILFGEASRHVPYFEYERANPIKFRRYFKFAFVRNPWDRLVSTYFFLRAGGMNDQDRAWAERNLSGYADFGDFVREWLNEQSIWSWIHFYPQYHFVLNDAGSTMVDYLGRFERLDADFQFVARRLGMVANVPKSNKSNHRHFATYYDDKTREIVARVYARDIDAFGYKFGDDFGN